MSSVPATPLNVKSTLIIFHHNFNNGPGDVEVVYYYPGYPQGSWTYDDEYKVWKECTLAHSSTTFHQYARSRLAIPGFAVPAGITAVKCDLVQWYGAVESGDTCNIQYSTNGGGSWTTSNTWWNAGGSSSYSTTETYTINANIINKPNAGLSFYFSSNLNTTVQGTGWHIREIKVYIEP